MMNALWDTASLRLALAVPIRTELEAHGVSIDTRTLQAGDIFIALKGEREDGNAYVGEALERGAAAVVCTLPHHDARVITVANTTDALNALAKAARARSRAVVFAITGSVGKTTSKEMLAASLAAYGQTHATLGNLNNHYGLPLTLARLPQEAVYAVLEMGMNHTGEITPLTLLAKPHHALITTIAPVHLEHFTSIDGIADAKAEIFSSTPRTAVLPFDSPQYERLDEAAKRAGVPRRLTFGTHQGAAIRLQTTEVEPNGGTLATIRTPTETLDIAFVHSGKPVLLNALAVLAMLTAADLPLSPALEVLAVYTPGKGRGEAQVLPWPGGQITLIDDTYNASPPSVTEALVQLGRRGTGRKVAVLGDMLELGQDSAVFHAALASPIRQQGVDVVFTVGTHMQALGNALAAVTPSPMHLHTNTAADMAAALKQALQPGDTVLVKGSAGMKMGGIVQALQKNSIA
jgi:UDP-N-acetylmuramoyl-tripeptide--D-alanyl-D-alanine ligase